VLRILLPEVGFVVGIYALVTMAPYLSFAEFAALVVVIVLMAVRIWLGR
jgi:hypothetical protein